MKLILGVLIFWVLGVAVSSQASTSVEKEVTVGTKEKAQIQAQEVKPAPLSFSIWKAKQILEAQNKLVRLKNKLQIEKARMKTQGEGSALQDQDKSEESKDVQKLEEDLELARDLTFDQYLVVYLSQFEDDEEGLKSAASKLSDEERLLLLKLVLKEKNGLQESNSDTLSKTSSVFPGWTRKGAKSQL